MDTRDTWGMVGIVIIAIIVIMGLFIFFADSSIIDRDETEDLQPVPTAQPVEPTEEPTPSISIPDTVK